MRIEYYVVTTKLKPLDLDDNLVSELSELKKSLILEYGGLSESDGLKGFWVNSNGVIEYDTVRLWTVFIKDGAENTEYPILEDYARKLRRITKQDSQLFVINNQPHFISE